MPSEENNFSNQTAAQPGNEPPAYYNSYAEEPVWNVSSVTPSEQTWNDCPPAYDSLLDIPVWSIPIIQPTAPTEDQLWNFPLPIPEYSEASPNTNTNRNSGNTPISFNTLFKQKFQRGKPICVGVLVISCAFVQIAVGMMLAFNTMRDHSETLSYGIPYWTSVCYIITGCLLIAAKIRTTRSRVKISIAFDILSMILSIIGLVFNIRDIVKFCNDKDSNSACRGRMQDSTYKTIRRPISTLTTSRTGLCLTS
ncbi:uncharacterized protein LOC120910460 [Rana temporaria]|uniref:uncharacterized protein LOC120910460 n=1 Tax=Rana temporaria TaxID=8407 RepID=UPI001AADD7ED|nr:uncharacterized protein LOC120910460 [Rana temporaria]